MVHGRLWMEVSHESVSGLGEWMPPRTRQSLLPFKSFRQDDQSNVFRSEDISVQARLWRLEHGAHLRHCPEINEAFAWSATHECSAEEACPMNHLVFDFSKHELVVPASVFLLH